MGEGNKKKESRMGSQDQLLWRRVDLTGGRGGGSETRMDDYLHNPALGTITPLCDCGGPVKSKSDVMLRMSRVKQRNS